MDAENSLLFAMNDIVHVYYNTSRTKIKVLTQERSGYFSPRFPFLTIHKPENFLPKKNAYRYLVMSSFMRRASRRAA
ncbi:MAG: hypothetical protein IJY02_04550, partial [Oscillospiraceae bacterium]|nr:hypothetical protein [Oscillospiraceae bacterium]